MRKWLREFELKLKVYTNILLALFEINFDICCVFFFLFLSMFTDFDGEVMFMANAEVPMRKGPVTTTEKKKETVRKFFPETWIWDIVPVG